MKTKLVYDRAARLHSHIKQAILVAMQDKVLVHDFTTGAKIYAGKEPQKSSDKFIEYEDYLAVMAELEEKMSKDSYYIVSNVPAILYLIFRTGMRFGEAIALSWGNVDFEKERIRTSRRYSTKREVFIKPKNATSVRAVPMDKKLADKLQQLKRLQSSLLEKYDGINKQDLIFYHPINKVVSNEAVNKQLKTMLEWLGVTPLITSKGGRHTYGSVLLYKGIDMGVLAKFLGHSNINMLIEVYGHTLVKSMDENEEKVKGYLSEM
jgi:integrase